MTSATINGNTYSDDGAAARDMLNGGHRSWFLPMVSDVVTIVDAINGKGVTSETAITIGTGSHTFATAPAATAYAANTLVKAVSQADPAKWMIGTVTSHGAGSLIISVAAGRTSGAGSVSDWIITPYVLNPIPGLTGNGSKFLRVNAGASGLEFAAVSTSPTISAQAANFAATTTDNTVYVVSDTAVCTLPDASSGGVAVGFKLQVKNATDGKGVTLARAGSDTIDGLTSYRVPGREIVELVKTANDVWTVTRSPNHMVGQVVEWATNTLPGGGWAWLNAQALSRTDYKGLFDEWGTTYGVGDGSTTFNVRDDRGRVKAGQDDMGGAAAASRLTSGGSGVDGATLGASGGTQTHTLTAGEMPSHTHSVTFYAADGGSTNIAGPANAGSVNGSAATSSAGSGGAHQNTQPTIIANFIVKT